MIGKAVLSSIRVGGTAVLGVIANLLLIPIVLYYLLMDWHTLVHRIRNFIPRRWLGIPSCRGPKKSTVCWANICMVN